MTMFVRRGRVLPFRPTTQKQAATNNALVTVPNDTIDQTITEVHDDIIKVLGSRLNVIPDSDDVQALTEMLSQVVVLGGLARHMTADVLPTHLDEWIEANILGFSNWLRDQSGNQ